MAIYLVDTNVLLRFVARAHPLHQIVRTAVRKLRASGHKLRVTPQNFVEFWNVATRPVERNGFGLTTVEADRLLRLAERLFPLLPDSPVVYPQWRRLVVTFGVSGVQVHDARLVAAMISHGVTHILTFNTTDFVRYATEGIMAVDPATV
ncbi:PIN domain-containing protein [Candidatus Poribacteria bacterium]|nr:PIN domain-containing protein [Candidatus Poribacteria bacterium]